MDVDPLVFTGHAVRQMFTRRLSTTDVRSVIQQGEVIADYPDDIPFPSKLLLGFVVNAPVHVVIAYDEDLSTGYVVTAYRPDRGLWSDDFKTRRPT